MLNGTATQGSGRPGHTQLVLQSRLGWRLHPPVHAAPRRRRPGTCHHLQACRSSHAAVGLGRRPQSCPSRLWLATLQDPPRSAKHTLGCSCSSPGKHRSPVQHVQACAAQRRPGHWQGCGTGAPSYRSPEWWWRQEGGVPLEVRCVQARADPSSWIQIACRAKQDQPAGTVQGHDAVP